MTEWPFSSLNADSSRNFSNSAASVCSRNSGLVSDTGTCLCGTGGVSGSVFGDRLLGWTWKDGSGPGELDGALQAWAGCWFWLDCANSNDCLSWSRPVDIRASSWFSLSSFSEMSWRSLSEDAACVWEVEGCWRSFMSCWSSLMHLLNDSLFEVTARSCSLGNSERDLSTFWMFESRALREVSRRRRCWRRASNWDKASILFSNSTKLILPRVVQHLLMSLTFWLAIKDSNSKLDCCKDSVLP